MLMRCTSDWIRRCWLFFTDDSPGVFFVFITDNSRGVFMHNPCCFPSTRLSMLLPCEGGHRL